MSGPERGRLLKFVLRRNEPADALAAVARSAVAGDGRATRTLLVALGPHLLRVVRRVLGARHPDIDDVLQESAFAVMEALPRHRGESTIVHFACRIAILTAISVRRREATQKRLRTRDDAVPVEAYASRTPSPDAE